jgi:hypothetical protein
MPGVVHQFWFDVGKPVSSTVLLPALARVSRASFIINSGCNAKLWSYQQLMDTDGAVETFDAATVLPFAEFKKHLSKNHIAHVVDYFRYLLVLKHGGWWADMDCLCLRRLPTVQYAFETQVWQAASARRSQFSDGRLGRFSNALFRCPRNDPHLLEMVRFMRRELTLGITDWDSVMVAHAAVVRESGLAQFVKPPVWFAPLINCKLPAEDDITRHGFLYPGMESIRRKSFVIDCARAPRQLRVVMSLLQALDTAGSRKLLPIATALF